jgi:hypothetical protein
MTEQIKQFEEQEKKVLDEKKELERKFAEKKAKIDALEREVNHRFDNRIQEIRIEDSLDLNLERQEKLKTKINEIKDALKEQKKILGELEAISNQLSLDKRTFLQLISFKSRGFDDALSDIPPTSGQTINAATTDKRRKAKEVIASKRDIEGMSFKNVILENKNLLAEHRDEIKILEGKLAPLLKAKEKIDKAVLNSEHRIKDLELDRKWFGLEKPKEIEVHKDKLEFEKNSRDLSTEAEKIKSGLSDLNKWFGVEVVTLCNDKGIDAVPNKEEVIKRSILNRNAISNAVCFKLEQSLQKIDKTLENKKISDKFKTSLTTEKGRQKQLLDDIRQLISKEPTDKQVQATEGNWAELRKLTLDAFPGLKQTNLSESSIESIKDPKARFEQIIEFIAEVRDTNSSTSGPENTIALMIKQKVITGLINQAVRTIRDMRDLECQITYTEALYSQIDKCVNAGMDKIEDKSKSQIRIIFLGMCNTIKDGSGGLDEKALLLADTGIRMSKFISEGKIKAESEYLQVFFDVAYTLAIEHIKTAEYTHADKSDTLRDKLGKFVYNSNPDAKETGNSVDEISRQTLLTIIEEKALEAGLNLETSRLEKKRELYSSKRDLLNTAIGFIHNENVRQAIDTLEVVTKDSNPQSRVHVACEVLKVSDDTTLRAWSLSVVDSAIEESINDFISLPLIRREIEEVLMDLGNISKADTFNMKLIDQVKVLCMSEAENAVKEDDIDVVINLAKEVRTKKVLDITDRENMAFEMCSFAKRIAGHDPKKLRELATFVFDNFKTEKGEVFVVDIFKTIGDVSRNSTELRNVTVELLDMCNGFNTPHLKETALEMFNQVEERIENGKDRTENYITLYSLMNHYGIIGYDEAINRYKKCIENSEDNVDFALETPVAIDSILEKGIPMRPALAEKFLNRAEERAWLNHEHIIKFAVNLKKSNSLHDAYRRFVDHRDIKIKEMSSDQHIDFLAVHHKSDEKPFGEDWSNKELSLHIDRESTEDILKVAAVTNELGMPDLTFKAYSKIVEDDAKLQEVSDANGLGELFERIRVSPSFSKIPLLVKVAGAMMDKAGHDLQHIEDVCNTIKGNIPDVNLANILDLKVIKGENLDNDARQFNTGLADLMIELHLEKEGDRLLASLEPALEDTGDGDTPVDIMDEMDEGRHEVNVPRDRIVESKARRTKNKKPKKKGFWASIFKGLFGKK